MGNERFVAGEVTKTERGEWAATAHTNPSTRFLVSAHRPQRFWPSKSASHTIHRAGFPLEAKMAKFKESKEQSLWDCVLCTEGKHNPCKGCRSRMLWDLPAWRGADSDCEYQQVRSQGSG